MKFKLYTLYSLITLFSLVACTQKDIDIVNAYEFKVDDTPLFCNYDEFIERIGLPKAFTAFKDTFQIENKAQLDSIIEVSKKSTQMLNLCYSGYTMEYFPDNYIAPLSFDFRNSGKEIKFNAVTFNSTFTTNDFRKLFPISAQAPLSISMELFSQNTITDSPDIKAYIVERKSNDVEFGDSGPSIMFTFEKERLIFIFFANF